MPNYTAGLDLGQSNDYSALIVAEHWEQDTGERSNGRSRLLDHFEVRLIRRWRGEAYQAVIDAVCGLLGAPDIRECVALRFDATGLGRVVKEMLHEAWHSDRLAHYPWGTSFTSGRLPGDGTVPKAHLMENLEVLAQAGRLKVASTLKLAPALREELVAFRGTRTATGYRKLEAEGGGHDDLVAALALAVWSPRRTGEPSRISPDGSRWPR